MHKATCSKCGDSCELPFRPSGSRPVFCSNCFDKQDGGGSDRRPNNFGSDRRERSGGFRDKQMHDAVCDACGENCQVPFRPTSGKKIYCSNCFDKNGGTNKGGRNLTNKTEYSDHLDAIHTKLNMIMDALGLDGSKKQRKEKAKKLATKKEKKETKKAEKPVAKKKVEKKISKKVVKKLIKKAVSKKAPAKKKVAKKTVKKVTKAKPKAKAKKVTKKPAAKKKEIKISIKK